MAGKNRRKLSWDDYNPDHVESGRLESFPVQGAFWFAPFSSPSLWMLSPIRPL
jgi:hypothetical protein